ncbi:hypothetical protein ACFQ1S_19385 [Kibdelosporangium lantanae]|uniref:Uncharacterized protein n=1 Tax=Kibdelosporangium lantanae TaxID=1497396 RepID=A0ABW3MD65_9PSEU
MRIVNVTTAVVAYHGEATLVRIDTTNYGHDSAGEREAAELVAAVRRRAVAALGLEVRS